MGRKIETPMNNTLLKALLAAVPAVTLFSGALVLFWRRRNTSSLLQLLGSLFLVVVVLTHLCEGFHLLPGMRWGIENSPGHDVDLFSAIMSLIFFPVGYLLHAIAERRAP